MKWLNRVSFFRIAGLHSPYNANGFPKFQDLANFVQNARKGAFLARECSSVTLASDGVAWLKPSRGGRPNGTHVRGAPPQPFSRAVALTLTKQTRQIHNCAKRFSRLLKNLKRHGTTTMLPPSPRFSRRKRFWWKTQGRCTVVRLSRNITQPCFRTSISAIMSPRTTIRIPLTL